MYKVISDDELKKEARLSKRLEKKGLQYPPVKREMAKKMKHSYKKEIVGKGKRYESDEKEMGGKLK